MKLCPPHKTRFNGQTIQPGQAVEVSEGDAESLIKLGWTYPEDDEPAEADDEEQTEELETDEEI
jgi:hypothetical protein